MPRALLSAYALRILADNKSWINAFHRSLIFHSNQVHQVLDSSIFSIIFRLLVVCTLLTSIPELSEKYWQSIVWVFLISHRFVPISNADGRAFESQCKTAAICEKLAPIIDLICKMLPIVRYLQYHVNAFPQETQCLFSAVLNWFYDCQLIVALNIIHPSFQCLAPINS